MQILNTEPFSKRSLTFLIIAFSIFVFIRLLNRFKKKEEEKPAVVVVDTKEEILKEIRDLLKENPQAIHV